MNAPKLEILAYEPSKLGLLCLRRRDLPGRPGVSITEITLEHEFLMSSYLTASERALSTIALEMRAGTGFSVLVGGLGLGYTAHAALQSDRVASVDVVEYLPQVIQWMRDGLVPLAAELNADARLRVIEGDVYARLLAPPERRYDLILIDVDHSPTEALGSTSAAFYAEEGLRRARLHLAPGGVLGVWSYAQHSPFADALRRVFGVVREEPVTAFNDLIDEEQTDWLFFVRA